MVCYLVTFYYTAFEEKPKGVTLELFTKMKMSSKICLFLPKIFILLLFFGCRKTQTHCTEDSMFSPSILLIIQESTFEEILKVLASNFLSINFQIKIVVNLFTLPQGL
jgi:hypothetical protein